MSEQLSIAPGHLATKIQSKSREAFSMLYDSYNEALFGIICRMVDNRPAAEELLQDSFVKIWKNIHLYDAGKGTLFTWMLNITRNICIDFLRSKQHRQAMQIASNSAEALESSITPGAQADATVMDLQRFTNQLEEKHRQVIDMVYFKGYTHEEVAHMLNIPVGTVKTRSRTGLKLLRDLYI